MSLLDMIGPVMVGPSSSHTAGACRLGLVAHHLLGEPPRLYHAAGFVLIVGGILVSSRKS